MVAVIDRWSLFGGGRKLRLDYNSEKCLFQKYVDELFMILESIEKLK